ncbi:putative Ig domain-containing protein [Anaerolineales bacterium HSG25]|nr:putative Ig domain-containing protein [Anaerolineales bacterium HSG25]
MNVITESQTRRGWVLMGAIILTMLIVMGRGPSIRDSQAAPLGAEIIVSSAADTTGSNTTLRDAINNAASGDVISFNAAYNITLASPLEITKNLTINASTITGVTINGGGDQVFTVATGITARFINLTITNGGTVTNGAGIYNYGTLTVEDSSISASTAISNGGGIYNASGAMLTLNNSTVSTNIASVGGNIYNAGTMTLTRVSVYSGKASTGGGIHNTSTLNIYTSTISSNFATDDGGGLYNTGTLTLRSDTVSANTSNKSGGGIYNSSTTVTISIYDSTIVDNRADNDASNPTGDGGGIYSGTVTIRNSIIANNSDSSPLTVHPDCSGTLTGNYNLIEDTTGCTVSGTNNITGQDPQLGTLSLTGTHALLPGSPAIDTGGNCLANDQRGVVRPQGTGCDIGAYELIPQIDLQISKTSDPISGSTVLPGQLITYTITLKNNGPDMARGVMITDTFPTTGLNFISVISSGVVITRVRATHVYSVENLASADTGIMTMVGEVNTTVISGTTFTNSVTISSSHGFDETDATNNDASVLLTVISPTVTLSPVSDSLGEADTNLTLTAMLSHIPMTDTTVQYRTIDGTATGGSDYQTINNGVLTFTAGTKSLTFTVTISDDIIEEATESFSVTLSNPTLAVLGTAVTSTINIKDNDTAGVVINPTNLNTAEGGITATYTISLTTSPTATVNITATTDVQTRVITGGNPFTQVMLTFNDTNWSTPQTVTVIAFDDDIIEANPHTGLITHTIGSNDPNYNVPPLATLTTTIVTITDNDVAGVYITKSITMLYDLNESVGMPPFEGGYQMALKSKPTAPVTITINPDAQTTVSSATVVFSPVNWNTPQAVTITAVDDSLVEGTHTSTINHDNVDSDDLNYDNTTPFIIDGITSTTRAIIATIIDNEAGFTVVASTATITEGHVGTQSITFTVQQVGSVTVTNYTLDIGSDATPGIDYQNLVISGTPRGSSGTITFTGASTSAQALITLDIIGDYIDENDEKIQLIISTYDYAVTTIIDDDTAGVSALRIFGNTFENGNSTNFPIVLTSQPTDTVTLNLVSSDTSEGTLTPASLIFDTINWNVPQVITVTGVDDALTDGHITYTVNLDSITTTDPLYSALIVPMSVATVTNIDDETLSNLPPTVTLTTATLSISENMPSPPIPFTVADDSTAVANITVVITSMNQTLLPDANIVHSGAGTANQSVTLTPALSETGTVVVQITATDTDGASSTEFIILTVEPNNQAPVANNDTKHTSEDTPVTIAILANDNDADGSLDASTVMITLYPSNGTITQNASDGSVTYTPSANFNNSDTFSYRVKDNEGADSNTALVFIGVTAENDTPTVVNTIADQTTEADMLYNYTVPANTFDDVDGDVLSYTARLVDGTALPTWLTFVANSRTFTGTPTNTETDVLNIEVVAIDPFFAEASTNFKLTVEPNSNTAPTLVKAIPDQTSVSGNLYNLNGASYFRDMDVGDTLVYSIARLDGQPLPSWLFFNSNSGQLSGTPPSNIATEAFKIQITATDSDGESVMSNDFTFNIDGQTATATPTATATVTVTATATVTSTPTPTATPDPSEVGSINGLVRSSSTGEVLPNINVIADYFDGTTWQTFVANTATDDTGQYQLTSLISGTYRLRFADTNPTVNYANLYYISTINPDSATPIEVESGQAVSGINMNLPLVTEPLSSVSGNVGQSSSQSDSAMISGGWAESYMTVDFEVTCDSGTAATNVQLLIDDSETLNMSSQSGNSRAYTVTMTDFPASGTYAMDVQWLCDGVVQKHNVGQLYVPTDSVSGQITGQGEPIEGATVTLYEIPNPTGRVGETRQTTNCSSAKTSNGVAVDPQKIAIGPAFNPQTTGPDGRYVWDVPSGCWYIVVQTDDYDNKTSPISADSMHLNLELANDMAVYLPVIVR